MNVYEDELDKALSPNMMGVLGAAGAGAVGAGFSETRRRYYNRRGADIKPLEGVVHPLHAYYKRGSVSDEGWGNRGLRRAARKDAKAAANPGTDKGARAQRSADRSRGFANRSMYNSQANYRAGQVGGIRADREMRAAGGYRGSVTYQPPDRPTRKVSKADLPGDNRKAQMSRSRRKAGLATATGGYIIADRAGKVAPGAADLFTRPAAKVGGETKRLTLVADRTKSIARHAGIGGAVLVGGGLALAGEGSINDLRHRRSVQRGHHQVRASVREVVHHRPRPEGDAVQPETVGQQLHKGVGSFLTDATEKAGAKIGGKAGGWLKPLGGKVSTGASGFSDFVSNKIGHPVAAGAKPIGAKVTSVLPDKVTAHLPKPAVSVGAGVKPPAGKLTARLPYETATSAQPGLFDAPSQTVSQKVQATGNRFTALKPKTQLGLAAGAGVGVGATGVYGQRKLSKADPPVAQRVRRLVLAKAYDSEASRHSRQNMYVGGASGAATVAAAGSARAGVLARRARNESRTQSAAATGEHKKLQGLLTGMEKPPPRYQPAKPGGVALQPGAKGFAAQERTTQAAAAKNAGWAAQRARESARTAHQIHGQAAIHSEAAGRLASKARHLTRGSIGAALGAAALGGAAYGVHDYDRRRGGQSYGY